MKIVYIIVLLFVLVSCSQKDNYRPEGLRKLTDNELIEAAKQDSFLNLKNAIFKNINGSIITKDSLAKLSYPCYRSLALDRYVDKNNNIIEVIIRPATRVDKELAASISLASQKALNIELVDIDCKKIEEILDSIYILDQEMRQNGNSINLEIDNQNINKVISIINKCGMPTLDNVNTHQMDAIWLVFQHTQHSIIKEYFPLFQESAKNGNTKLSHIALMTDRLLMNEGKPQLYGSQIQQACKNKWEIYDLDKPKTVDKRRHEMGLKPLSEYVSYWGIEFTVKQIK